MRFRLVADCTFDADDIDYALQRLGEHFTKVGNGEDTHDFFRGSVEVKAISDEQDQVLREQYRLSAADHP